MSLLTEGEVGELGLTEEPLYCQTAGIELIRFPVPDRGVPASSEAWTVLVDRLVTDLRQDRTVGVHCRGGIGRSGMLAAAVLVRLGMRAEEALEAVGRARGLSVPDTAEQMQWIRAWAG